MATGGAGDKIVNLWNTETGQLVQAFGEAPSDLHLPRQARVLARWHPSAGRRQHVVEGVGRSENTERLRATTLGSRRRLGGRGTAFVAFSPDGTLALTSDRDNGLEFWSVETGQLVRTFKPKLGTLIAVSPDATRVLSQRRAQTSSRLWDVASGQLLRTFEGHSIGVASVATSPDGDPSPHGRQQGEAVGCRERQAGAHDRRAGPNSVAFSPDGARLLAGSLQLAQAVGRGERAARPRPEDTLSRSGCVLA